MLTLGVFVISLGSGSWLHIRACSFLPTRWETNAVSREQYGCLCAEQVGEVVPVLAEALVVKGRRRLVRSDRIDPGNSEASAGEMRRPRADGAPVERA